MAIAMLKSWPQDCLFIPGLDAEGFSPMKTPLPFCLLVLAALTEYSLSRQLSVRCTSSLSLGCSKEQRRTPMLMRSIAYHRLKNVTKSVTNYQTSGTSTSDVLL